MRANMDNRYLVPALGRLYQRLEFLAYPLTRWVSGFIFMTHGAARFRIIDIGGPTVQGTAGLNAKLGLEPAMFWSQYVTSLELVGGILLILGFLTRPAAFLLAGFMAVATFYVTFGNGFFARGAQGTGWEYPLVLFILTLSILLRGGGPLSIDRFIGREV